MIHRLFSLLKISTHVLVSIALLLIALYWRDPIVANVRSVLFWSGLSGGVILSLIGWWGWTTSSGRAKRWNLGMGAIACLSLTILLTGAIHFQLTKQFVLKANPQRLETLGQHLVVGYRDPQDLNRWLTRRAIGGIFITRRNIEDKSREAIQQEIATWQSLRSSQALPPLWIATDQEGGIVSRLSPPLTQLPALAEVVDRHPTPDQQEAAVIQYAEVHGRELSDLGINLNFAPVVDLNKGVINPNDRFSQIYRRAISSDQAIVEQVGRWYCQTLDRYGVHCTLKHFPGLGRVANDTHLEDAKLDTSIQELAQEDWIPFQQIPRQSKAMIMVGHAKLMTVDPIHPVSFSQAVITEIVRNNWGYDGVLITDDFTMKPVSGSADGVGQASVKALNAGIDLILISFDPDLYYDAMAALLRADQNGQLNPDVLNNSHQRLQASLGS